MYRPESLIIDNDKIKLFEEINKILKEQKIFDVATAYFNIAGFQLIKDSVLGVEKFRLLLGISPEKEKQKPDYFEPERQYKKNIRLDLEDEKFEKEKKETVLILLDFLNNPNTQVRLYNKGFLHGKVYIFGKLAILGSSNFTYSGFTSNTELNAVLDEPYSRYIREEWYEKFWKESSDFKKEFIQIIDESKFGTKEYSPYQIFIKALYELQKEDLLYQHEIPEILPDSEVNLANFQEDAVKRIYSRLKTYNGVLIADSVGLGKTWIAKKILEDFGFYRRRKFIVVCPASVDELLWRPALKEIGVSENIIHQEELGRDNFDFNSLEKKLNLKLENISLIVIDESHNFRNPYSNRYENLFTLVEKAGNKIKPKIILLTATPMNNTHWDLYFQLMLLAQNNKRAFFKEGIFDLEKQFKKADKGDISQLADILQIISIRRTRQYIKDNYPDAKYKDENDVWTEIRFPKRELFEINYSLDETYQGLYYQIAEKIEKELNLAYYRLEEYRIVGKKDVMELGRMKALGGILQTLLFKRLESSVEAFRKSIQTQIDFLVAFKEVFMEGKVLRKKFYNKYLAYLEEGDENSDYLIDQLKKNLENIDPNDFDITKFYEDLDKDIEIFKEIVKLVSPINKEKDAKIQQLKAELINLSKKGKILLFSFYADTVDYLYEALTEDANFHSKLSGKIDKITGSFPTNKRITIIDNFLNGETQILLSTDILSEGQNLQRARIVINYDLHWNPVRMIQRAGRIDRIGTPFDNIFIHNFFPEHELESLLNLVKILQKKIEIINDTIGLDASVLGETISPKVFGIIRDLKGRKEQKNKVLEELEEGQFGGGEKFWQPLRDFGLERLQEFCRALPQGIQSGLKRGFRGVFFYYKYEEDYHLWFLYDVMNDNFITNKTEILEFISCKENESRTILEDIDVFEIHRQLRDEIRSFFSEGKVATGIRTVHGRMEKTLRDLRDELDYIIENYFDEDDPLRAKISELIDNLLKVSLTKLRMRTIRKIWKEYRTGKNWHQLIANLRTFLAEKPTLDEQVPFEFEENKLKLICVDFIS